MALTILNSPGNNSSVSSEMLFVINEATKANDPVTYPNYFYILDIYVDGDIVARQRIAPDPTYKFGKADVSVILRDYVPVYKLKANYTTFQETYETRLTYHVELGEEYDGTTYTNLVTDSDRTCYKTYKERPFTSSDAVTSVSNGVASNMPKRLTGFRDEVWRIVPFFSNASGTIEYETYRSAGTSIYSGTTSFSGTNRINTLNLGLTKLAAVTSSDEEVDKIRFAFNGDDYYVNIRCSKYPVTTLAWLNPYGAYESYGFGMVSKRTNQVTRKDFSKLPYEINASGVVSYDADGVLYGTKKTYSNSIKSTLSLTSHLLTDGEYTWLADLFSSPDVYRYDDTLSKFVPCVIVDSNYDYRTYLNSRLTPLQFNIEFAEYNSQFL